MSLVFSENFDTDNILASWDVVAGSQAKISVAGGILYLGDNSTADEDGICLVSKQLIPYDERTLYTMSARMSSLGSGARKVSVGIIGYAADGVTIIDSQGGEEFWYMYKFVTSDGEVITPTPTDYTGYFKGINVVEFSSVANHESRNQTEPFVVRRGTKFIRPFVYANIQFSGNTVLTFVGRAAIEHITLDALKQPQGVATGTPVITVTPASLTIPNNGTLECTVNITNFSDGALAFGFVPGDFGFFEFSFTGCMNAFIGEVIITGGTGTIVVPTNDPIRTTSTFQLKFFTDSIYDTPIIDSNVFTLVEPPPLPLKTYSLSVVGGKTTVRRGESITVRAASNPTGMYSASVEITNNRYISLVDFSPDGFNPILLDSNKEAIITIADNSLTDYETPGSFQVALHADGYTNVAYTPLITVTSAAPLSYSMTVFETEISESSYTLIYIQIPSQFSGQYIKCQITGVSQSDISSCQTTDAEGNYVNTILYSDMTVYVRVTGNYYSYLKIFTNPDGITEGTEILRVKLIDDTSDGRWRLPSPSPSVSIPILDTSKGIIQPGETFGFEIYGPNQYRILDLSNRAMLFWQQGSATLTAPATTNPTITATVYVDVVIAGIVNDGTWVAMLTNTKSTMNLQTWLEIFSGYIRLYLRKDYTYSSVSDTLQYTVFKV